MKLSVLKAENFRNFTELSLDLGQYLNVITGDNGSGKTTFLEMIYCLARGSSFRTHLKYPLIRSHQKDCTVFGSFVAENFSTHVGFKKLLNGKTQIQLGVDKKEYSARELAQTIPVQLFDPECHAFFNEGPKMRRKFMAWGLFHLNFQFIDCWDGYQKVLRQRNVALMQKKSPLEIQSWDIEMAKLGEQLSQLQMDYIHQLIELSQPLIDELVGISSLHLHYYSGWDQGKMLLSALKESFNKDYQYGYTTLGPHRCDFFLKIDGVPVEKILSRGEQKRLILTLYLTQGQLLTQRTQKHCILLLDDVLSELDQLHQRKVLTILDRLRTQTFLTSLDETLFKTISLSSITRHIRLNQGIIVN